MGYTCTSFITISYHYVTMIIITHGIGNSLFTTFMFIYHPLLSLYLCENVVVFFILICVYFTIIALWYHLDFWSSSLDFFFHSLIPWTYFDRGDRPLPLAKLNLEGNVREKLECTLKVPNQTQSKLYFRVESDLDFTVSGPESITVLPGKTGEYHLSITPLRRGQFKGVVAFVAGANPIK